MDSLLPIGSIIEVNEIKLIVMGYREFIADTYKFFYIVGVFPLGFTGAPQSVTLLPVDASYKIIFRGYESASVKKYLETKSKVFVSLHNVDLELVEDTIDQIINRKGESYNE